MRMKILFALLPVALCAQTQIDGYRIHKDQTTPSAPSAGRTASYTKGGKLCSNSTGAGEQCTGGTGTGSSAVYTAVTYSSTPSFTCNSNTVNTFAITLTGNVTSSTLASCVDGQFVVVKICQDGTGSRTFAWPANVANTTTIDGTASACSNQSFIYDGSNAVPIGGMYVTGLAGGSLALYGSSSGVATLSPPATGGGALVLPAGAATLLPNPLPSCTFASPPGSPATYQICVFTDASSATVCTGGGSAKSTCVYNGSAWQKP